LAATRYINDSALEDPEPEKRIPNFSRYPGDFLGLRSARAMGASRNVFNQIRSMPERLLMKYFTGTFKIQEHGDPLAWDIDNNRLIPGTVPHLIRQAEIAAVAPDLFDATYYSIDPSYFLNYQKLFEKDPNRFDGALPPLLGYQLKVPPDIGGRNLSQVAEFNVQNQIATVVTGDGIDKSLLAADGAFWFIRKWEHLLTGWASHDAQDFSTFPSARFGRCDKAAPASVMIPGACAMGGRTGYSVRFVSRAYLLRGNWQVGGEGGGEGPLRNPPPDLEW
jgi:hypothetical protein